MAISLADSILTSEQQALLPNEADIQFYEAHGWYISPPVLPHDLIDQAIAGSDRYYQGERDYPLPIQSGFTDWRPGDGDGLRNNEFVSLQNRELGQLVRYPMIGAIAARLARSPSIRLLDDQLVYKPPGSSTIQSTVGWHADHAYWGTCSSHHLLTAWIPFHDCEEAQGPLVVLDGSHRWQDIQHTRFFNNTDLSGVETQFQAQGHTVQRVPMCLKKGQLSFHHCWTIHGSYPNRSTTARRALAVHVQDEANHYQPCLNPKGDPVQIIDEALCRKLPNGDPDFQDPAVFPQLWPC
jgi:hypothetical protein